MTRSDLKTFAEVFGVFDNAHVLAKYKTVVWVKYGRLTAISQSSCTAGNE